MHHTGIYRAGVDIGSRGEHIYRDEQFVRAQTNHIKTAAGREDERPLRVKIVER